MSTAVFDELWRRSTRTGAATLVRLDLMRADGSATDSFYLSTRETQTPVGSAAPKRLWETAVETIGPVHHPGSFKGSDIELCTCPLVISKRKLGPQAAGKTSFDTLKDYRWDATAVVTVYLWDEALASFDDASQEFKGTVFEVAMDAVKISVVLRQRSDWNRPLCSTFSRDAWIPQENVGLAKPIAYGSLASPGMRWPFVSKYGNEQRYFEALVGVRRSRKAIIYESGKVSNHLWAMICNNGVMGTWLGNGRRVAVEGPLGTVDLLRVDQATAGNDASFRVPFTPPLLHSSQDGTATMAARPIGVALGNTADYAMRAFDGDETTPAYVDQAGAKKLVLDMADLPRQPYQYGASLVILYRVAAGTTGLRCQLRNTATGFNTAGADLTSTVPALATVDMPDPGPGSGWPTDYWSFSQCQLWVDWFGAGPYAGSAEIFEVGVIVGYFPGTTQLVAHPYTRKEKLEMGFRGENILKLGRSIAPAKVEPYAPSLYACVDGVYDYGNGEVTGTPSGLIERPSDMMLDLLSRICGEPFGNFNRTLGFVGNFLEARGDFYTRVGDMKLVAGVTDQVEARELLRSLCEASLGRLYISPRTDRWNVHAWRPASAATYPWKFGPQHVMDPSGPSVAVRPQEVLSSVSVSYGWDDKEGRYRHRVSIGPTSSQAGHDYFDLRDESCVVTVGTSDRLDVKLGATTEPVTLVAGTYSLETILAEVRARWIAQGTLASVRWAFAFGGVVVAGVNDRLVFYDGTLRTVFLTAGRYTMAALVAHVTTKMNSVSSGWTVTYDAVTQKTATARASGTAELRFADVSAVNDTCAALLGLKPNAFTGALSYAGQIEVSERMACVSSSATFSVLLRSGPNNTRSAYQAVGWSPQFDLLLDSIFSGQVPRNDGEQTAANAVARFKNRRELPIECQYINETETARALRDAHLALGGRPLVEVRYSTTYAPGLERGHTIEFDGPSMNTLTPYPDPQTDGSWAGKVLVVSELSQGVEFPFATEIVAHSVVAATTIASETVLDRSSHMVGRNGSQVIVHRTDDAGFQVFGSGGVRVDSGTGIVVDAYDVLSLSDGSCITAWVQTTAGVYSLRVQRLSSTGAKLWGTNGIEVQSVTGGSISDEVSLVTDRAGGAFLVWVDLLSGQPLRIACQRISPTGALLLNSGAPLRITTGAAVPTVNQQDTNVWPFCDSVGNLILKWDKQSDTFVYNRYIQRVSGSGTLTHAAGGLLISGGGGLTANTQTTLSGGKLFIRAELQTTIRITQYDPATGVAAWTTPNLATLGGSLDPSGSGLAPTGDGGVFVAFKNSPGALGLYLQRVGADGASQLAPEVLVSTDVSTTGTGFFPKIQSDGGKGCLLIWRSANHAKIKVARHDSSGNKAHADVVLYDADASAFFRVRAGVMLPDGSGGGTHYFDQLAVDESFLALRSMRSNPDGSLPWASTPVYANVRSGKASTVVTEQLV